MHAVGDVDETRTEELTIIAGSAHPKLAAAVAAACRTTPARCRIERFPDGELHVEVLERVRDGDVYVVQPSCPPVDANVMELLLLADACRRAGARRLTAVIPYFGYGRQDRRARGREPVSARLICDLIEQAGYSRVVSLDLHTPSLEGCSRIELEHMTAVPALAEAVRPHITPETTIVAADLGAAKLADKYALRLRRPMAIVYKTRASGREVTASQLVGDVRKRDVVIVDDMITTGATVEAAARAALAAGARERLVVVATHALLVEDARERLERLPLKKVIVSDSVLPMSEARVERVSIAGVLAGAISALHHGASLGGTGAHA